MEKPSFHKSLQTHLMKGNILGYVKAIESLDEESQSFIQHIERFHEFWKMNGKRNYRDNGHSIWGNRVIQDPDKRIKEVLNERDYEILRDFLKKNAVTKVSDINEDVLVLIMCLFKVDFQIYKRLLETLFGTYKEKHFNEEDYQLIRKRSKISRERIINGFDQQSALLDRLIVELNKVKDQLSEKEQESRKLMTEIEKSRIEKIKISDYRKVLSILNKYE